jgi:hypothetical protein
MTPQTRPEAPQSAVAYCGCGEAFTDPVEAATHWRETGHNFWSVPSSWLRDRPWTLSGLWRAVLREETP